MRVLLVEPDAETAQSVEAMLKAGSASVDATGFGEDAIELAKLYDFDIALLELTLPDISGFDVLRALRTAKIRTPILVVSAMPGIEDRLKAFGLGADDYLTKPFHADELVARIHAIVRRSRGHAQSLVTIDGLTIDMDDRTATVDGTAVHLTGREYQILELLALRKGKVMSKAMILAYLYGGMDEPEMKIIDVFLCKLRRKIAAASTDGRHFIETVWGRGYMLREHAVNADIAA